MHWVSEHNVTRSPHTYARPPMPPRRVRPPKAATRPRPTVRPVPFSVRWAQPNATCPLCGDPVYFWSNASGSRVYFDEMGPPWPRHPCLVGARPTVPIPTAAGTATAPRLRAFDDGRRAVAWPSPPRWRAAAAFRFRYGGPPAVVWLVLRCQPTQAQTVVHLHEAYRRRGPLELRVPGSLRLPPGTLVFIAWSVLSFVDPLTLDVVSVPVTSMRRLPRRAPASTAPSQ